MSRRVADSALWSVSLRTAALVVHGAAFVWLARLLTPAEYGLYTFAIVVVSLLSLLGQLGIRSALVQRPTLTPAHLCAACWLMLAMGAVGVIVIQLAALTLLEGSKAAVLHWCAFNLLLTNAAVVPLAMLQRGLRFRELLLIELAASIVGSAGVAIMAATAGWGVWSLVAGGLVRDGVVAAGAFVCCPQGIRLLALPRLSLLASLLRYGGPLTVTNGLAYLAQNGDCFLIGKLLGNQALGYYSRAFYIVNRLNLLVVAGLHGVLFAAFAQAHGQPLRLRNGYLRATRLLATVALPLFTAVALAAGDLVVLALGEMWLGVVPILQVCCVLGTFPALTTITDALLKATGNLRPQLLRYALHAVLVLVAATIGSRWGATGAALGVAAAACTMYLSMTRFALRLLGISLRSYAGTLLPGLLLAGVAAAGKLATDRWLIGPVDNALLRLATLGLVLLASLALLPLLLPAQATDALKVEGRLFRDALPRRARKLTGTYSPSRGQ